MKRRVIKTSGDLLKVNLGCGLKCLGDWVNIDGSLTSLFGNRRFSWLNRIIYSFAGSAAYYSFSEFNEIIKTCNLYFHNLKYGIPFRSNSIDVIYSSHFLEHLNETDGCFFVSECHRCLKPSGILRIAVPDLDIAFKMYKEGKVEEMLNLFFFTSDSYDFHMHKYNYNFQTLKQLLISSGFSSIDKRNFREGECPDINFLDMYPESSLYVEAQKR